MAGTGIDVYDNLPAHEQLRKAVNDARAMGAALRGLGFEAAVEENVARLAFTRAWQKFLNRLEPGEILPPAIARSSSGQDVAAQETGDGLPGLAVNGWPNSRSR